MTTGGTGGDKGAPSFTMSHATAVVGSKWSLHYVEYNIAEFTLTAASAAENKITANKPNILTKMTGSDHTKVLFNPMGSTSNWKILKGRVYGS